MAVTDAPKIITTRFDQADGHTLDGYLAHRRLPGHQGRAGQEARRRHRRGQERLAARPRRRRLPRRRQVGLLPARRVPPLPRGQRRRVRAGHLQGPPPHGEGPAPAHRGRAHRLLRGRLQPGVPLRARRDGLRPGAHRPGPQRRLRRRLRRQEHPRLRLLRRHRPALGCGRLHRRRGDGPHREPRGQPGHAPPQAAVLPGRQGPVPPAHHRQQRRDAGQPPVDRPATGERRSPPSAPRTPRACACSRCRAT